jgi:hypothetical protein
MQVDGCGRVGCLACSSLGREHHGTPLVQGSASVAIKSTKALTTNDYVRSRDPDESNPGNAVSLPKKVRFMSPTVSPPLLSYVDRTGRLAEEHSDSRFRTGAEDLMMADLSNI